MWGLGIGAPVVALLVLARRFGYIEPVPILLIIGELALTLSAMALFTRRFPPGTDEAKPRVQLCIQILFVGLIIYTIGWGSILAVGFIFPAATVISSDGSDNGWWAIGYIVVTVTLGEVIVGAGLVRSMVAGATDHGLALLEVAGTCAAVWVIARHQSAKEEVELRLVESAQRFGALIQHASDIILVVSSEGTISYASPAFETGLGYTTDDWDGMDATTLLSPDDVDFLSLNYDASPFNEGPRSLELRIRHHDGSWRWCEVIFTDLNQVPGINGWVANVRDITERKAAAEALREAHERFRSSFENAPIGMGLCDLEGRVIEINAAYGRIFGRSQEELVGALISDLTHPDDRASSAAMLEEVTSGKADTAEAEKRYLRPDGTGVWVSIKVSSVRGPDGKPLYLIGQAEDISERRKLRDQLAHDALHDPLTGLPNRILFVDRLELALRRVQRSNKLVAVMFLDLDHFKLVNDSLGHDSGDRLLVLVARQLVGALRSSDTLARFGGDEFTVLCEVDDREEALEVANRLGAALGPPISLDGTDNYISTSLGIALSVTGREGSAALLRNADAAMYMAKEAGPGNIRVYEADTTTSTIHRLRTSNELHRALDQNEFVLHYQPVIELHRHSLVGIEALVRWQHPMRGLLPPDEFISLAEDSGLIVPLGYWILEEACRQAAEWHQKRCAAGEEVGRLNMSVNVSARQLSDLRFSDVVARILRETGLAADQLWLEITESTAMRQDPATAGLLHSLRALGLHMEIDDFGTGYSSLNYLKQLPVETLKIDRSFVAEIDRSEGDLAIVRAITALGDSLGLSVVAEGVERATQADKLRALNCFLAQGYLYGLPMPASALSPFPTDDLSSWDVRSQSSA